MGRVAPQTMGGFTSSTIQDVIEKKERFSSDIDIVDSKGNNKWWDEVLLGRETIIKNLNVDTTAVQ